MNYALYAICRSPANTVLFAETVHCLLKWCLTVSR